ncbi:TolC family protein, partial [Escherichia coli]|uniref:TolC family protein n=1 Tax=Escherichia coli TaxID=562 RepID=UPI0028DF13B0
RYYEVLDAVQGKALEAVQAYEDVRRYRAMVELAQRNYGNHQRVFEQIGQRARSGVGNRADLLQISGRRSLAESNLLTE